VKILSLNPPDIFVNPVDESLDYGEEEAAEDKAWLWPRFCNVVWDSVAKGAARDLKTFTSVCFKLWRPFVQPIIDGNFGTRDFTKLLVARRSIFQSEDFLSGTTVMKRHGDATDAKSKTGEQSPLAARDFAHVTSCTRVTILYEISALCSLPSIIQPASPRPHFFYAKYRSETT